MTLLPIFAIVLEVAAPLPKEVPKKVGPDIVGEWACVQLTIGGREVAAKDVERISVKITADGNYQLREGRSALDGTYTTDCLKNPAQMDVLFAKISRRSQLIYKVHKDRLTLCYADGGGNRPTEFESPAGSQIALLTFTRVERK